MRSATGSRRASPSSGAWQDDRDDELAARLAAAGWTELWAGERAPRRDRCRRNRARSRGCARLPHRRGDARSAALGRRDAPATHATRASLAVPLRGGGLALGPPATEARPEPDARRKRHRARRDRARSASSSRSRPPHAGARGTRRRSPTSPGSRPDRSSSRSSMRARASSSARRSPPFRPCSRASPTRRSRRTRMTLLAWAAATNDGGLQDARAPLGR